MPDRDRVLRPLPFRGDLIAAGSVPLAVGVLLVVLRMHDSWAPGVRFAVVGAVAALLLLLAWRAPVERAAPRMYVSVLLVAAFPLLAVALSELADALGGSLASTGTWVWVLCVLAATYAVLARARDSAICTLLAAVTGLAALLWLWAWLFDPAGPTPYRWLLLAGFSALALGVVRLRDTRRAHAVALATAAGVAAVVLGLVLYTPARLSSQFIEGQTGVPSVHAPWGWKLILLALGFGLVAYAAADRERGPGWLGAIVLVLFVIVAADHASLLWWPLLLIVLGGAVIAAGLRPTTPAPPSPDADAPTEPPRPFAPPR